MILDDGTVLPSYGFFGSVGGRGDATDPFNNGFIRFGEVKEIVYPTDKLSKTKKVIEYKVEVQHGDGASAAASTVYTGCQLSNFLGGMADVCKFTLRPDLENANLHVGSKVVLACINGQSSWAIILGGVRDVEMDESTKDKKEDGHNFQFRFNGASFNINDSGEITLQYAGKTDKYNDPAPSVNPESSGSTINFDKDGSISAYTKDSKESIKLNHKDNKIQIETPEGKVEVKSTGMLVGDAQENFLLAKTYRQAEGQLHSDLTTAINKLIGKMSEISGYLLAAGTQLKVPNVGGVLAAPSIDMTSMKFVEMIQILTEMVAKIQSFEANAKTYLSEKNFND